MHAIILSISTLAYALYIYSFPLSFYNDDSLFLARGIMEFSIIDFSPHFPGYVSLILLGKGINFFLHDAKLSLFILTASLSILTPVIIYLYVRLISNAKVALSSFVLIITSPYLVNYSLSLLSDCVGFFFLITSLYLMKKKEFKLSGVILGIALFSRPSYFVFYIAGAIYFYIKQKEAIKPILFGLIIISLFFVAVIYITNGNLFFIEAQRFIIGHFTIWGNGQFSTHSWFENIVHFENLPFILLFFCLPLKKEFYLLYTLFIAYFIWIIFGQNPENMRHLIPLAFFASVFIAQRFSKYILILIAIFNLTVTLNYLEKYSPLEQIIQSFDEKEHIIITNRGVEVFRNKDFIVLDKFYRSRVKAFEKKNKNKDNSIYISADANEFKKPTVYKGRFLGERSLYLTQKKDYK